MPYYGAIENPLMIPAVRDITEITQASPAVITTSFAHGYKSNWWVRLIVPQGFGMTILNKRKFLITVLSPTTFSIPIDSSGFDAFVIPPYGLFPLSPRFGTPAQAVPVGEEAHILSATERNVNERPDMYNVTT
jgi:hypothetical protein